MEHKDYYMGLDMGTSTVGWAITDTEYHLMRKKGKDLWGIREFEEAKTAADRRSHRTSRRRREREKTRNNLIRSYFAEAIDAVDSTFFHRLDNSKYLLNDKDPNVKTLNIVFNDEGYKDKDYYKQYPTVFHLRKALLENTEAPYDVRLVYLAVSNLFKHRGHFLNSGLSETGETINLDIAYLSFVESAEFQLGICFPKEYTDELGGVITNRKLSKTQRTEELVKYLGIEKKEKVKIECCKAVCGRKVDINKIFEGIELEEKLSFSFTSFDEDAGDKIIKAVGEENYSLIESMKALHDACQLSEILNGYEYLSFARVATYEKHKIDLNVLKDCVRKFGNEDQYNKLFRSDDPGTYGAYVNSVNSGKIQRRDMKKRKAEDFYSYVKKLVKDYPDSEQKDYILREIDKETFMPKQLTSANGVIPNQVHARELSKILNNASGYLPFLNDIDDSGLTTAERIFRLFTYQIPYYIGPVTERSKAAGGNGWVIRKEQGAVLPWNIENKIDMDATRQMFISKLIRDCTYINGEKVLPKRSLMYEKFTVLNAINNIRVDDNKISVELKQAIYNELFKTGKKVTRKQIFTYLRTRGCLEHEEQMSGIDKEFSSSLSSYGKLKAVLGDIIDTDSGRTMSEDIIYMSSIYGDSKKFLKSQLRTRHKQLTDKQISRLIGMKFQDWGRLSKAFLETEGIEKETGEIRTIINALWETNNNLMELLSDDKFTYKQVLDERKSTVIKSLTDITPEALEEYYFSAPVRKMINQTIKIISEAETIMGHAPKRVFIEMTRRDDVKGDRGRKDSRKKQLIELYKSIKDDSHNWSDLIEREDASGKIRSKKMYLYITQMGRDMYTGKPIELEDLFDDNLYDIDHIYPRHFVKDDSIHNNLVLVNKRVNEHDKRDDYPLPSSIRNNSSVTELWKYLMDKKLITEEKYRRLICNKAFTDDQKAEFIARQLVETGQATKAVAELLRAALPDTTVVYSKASNISEFRREFILDKSRLINDFHHANDAYLNIVVGNIYYTKFQQEPRNYIAHDYKSGNENNEYHLGKMFCRDVRRGDEIAWKASSKDDPGTIATVREVMKKNTPLMTRQSFCVSGRIAEQTMYSGAKAKKANGNGYIPLKTAKDEKLADVTKYGGFTSVHISYFCLVEHTVRDKRIRSLEAIPLYLVNEINNDPSSLENYLSNYCGLSDVSVRIRKIPMQSLLRLNGFDVHISSKHDDNRLALRSAVNLCLEYKWVTYIKKLEKYVGGNLLPNEITIDKNIALYEELIYKHTNGIYQKRPISIGDKLKEGRERFCNLSVEQQCDVLIAVLGASSVGLCPNAEAFELIGMSRGAGSLRMNKTVSNYNKCELIYSSALGVSQKRIDLLTV